MNAAMGVCWCHCVCVIQDEKPSEYKKSRKKLRKEMRMSIATLKQVDPSVSGLTTIQLTWLYCIIASCSTRFG